MSKKIKTTVFFFSFLMALVVGNCLFMQKKVFLPALSSELLQQEFRLEQSKTPFEKTTEYLLVVECKDVFIKQMNAPLNDNKQPQLRVKSSSGMLLPIIRGNRIFICYQFYINSFHSFKIASRFIYCLFEKLQI